MLFLALALLSLAVLIGLAIGIRFLGDGRPPSRTIGAVHGLLGVSGLSALIFALVSGTGSGDRYGTASFGPAAAILATLAADYNPRWGRDLQYKRLTTVGRSSGDPLEADCR